MLCNVYSPILTAPYFYLQAEIFFKTAKEVKRKAFWKMWKCRIILGIVIALVLTGVIVGIAVVLSNQSSDNTQTTSNQPIVSQIRVQPVDQSTSNTSDVRWQNVKVFFYQRSTLASAQLISWHTNFKSIVWDEKSLSITKLVLVDNNIMDSSFSHLG